jgi:hypothetical protein
VISTSRYRGGSALSGETAIVIAATALTSVTPVLQKCVCVCVYVCVCLPDGLSAVTCLGTSCMANPFSSALDWLRHCPGTAVCWAGRRNVPLSAPLIPQGCPPFPEEPAELGIPTLRIASKAEPDPASSFNVHRVWPCAARICKIRNQKRAISRQMTHAPAVQFSITR